MTAPEPFVFYGCIELRELLAHAARDARELAAEIERAPEESIFFHTAGVLLRRAVHAGAYPNDFAMWADLALGDRRLAEQLALVDLFDAGSIEDVRVRLTTALEDHVRHLNGPPARAKGEPFAFCRAHLVPVPTGHQARTLREFRDGLAEMDASGLFFHLVEARYRLGRSRGDFGEWVAEGLGRADLAERLGGIDLYLGSLERIRDRHLVVLNQALEEERA